jgi:DnaJ-class molecular chaperone
VDQDHYKILGVSEKADEAEIKAAYRKLARQYHPDVNPGNKEAEEKFKSIIVAHETLSSVEKRAAYDQGRQNGAARGSAGARPTSARPQPSGARGGDPLGNRGADFNSMLDGLLGGGPAPWRRAGAGPTSDGSSKGTFTGPSGGGEERLAVSLEEAFHGATRVHTVNVDLPCPDCRGTGTSQKGRSGLQMGTMCLTCRGSRRQQGREEVTVTIPPGIYEGAKLRVKGKGPSDAGGNRGDLFLTVRLKKHNLYERDGSDLTRDVPVPYTTLVLGGEIEVPTLAGKKKLIVPPGTQSGQLLRMPGLGLPAIRDRAAGGLFARMKVIIPRQVSGDERTLLLDLARLQGAPVPS